MARGKRGPVTFKDLDVRRAVRACTAAGVAIGEVEVDPHSGKIIVRAADKHDDASKSDDEVEAWLRKQNANQS